MALALLITQSAAAQQTADPNFAWLPTSVRPEIRENLASSAWARRWESAVGWVILTAKDFETLVAAPGNEPSDEGSDARHGTPIEWRYSTMVPPVRERVYSCLDLVGVYAGDQAKDVYRLDTDFRFQQLQPGQVWRRGSRYVARRCFHPRDPNLLPSFEAARPAALEGKVDRFEQRYRLGLGRGIDPAELAQSPKRFRNEEEWYTEFTLSETDPELKAGAKIVLTTEHVRKKTWPDNFTTETDTKRERRTCELSEWRQIGSGPDALPFQAVRIGCQNSRGGHDGWSWVVPELGLTLDEAVVRGSLESGETLRITQEEPGRWRIQALQSNPAKTAAGTQVRDMIILSAQAAETWMSGPPACVDRSCRQSQATGGKP